MRYCLLLQSLHQPRGPQEYYVPNYEIKNRHITQLTIYMRQHVYVTNRNTTCIIIRYIL